MSETRIILLYSTKFEGAKIMKWAKEAGLTGRSYVWIVTQSVIGEGTALADLPAGMLGKYLVWPAKYCAANLINFREKKTPTQPY